MKKLLFFIFAVILTSPIEAQENDAPSYKELKAYYKVASAEERARLDSVFAPMEEERKLEQVKTIGGVPFGISRERALEMLRLKFGEPYDPDHTTISFKNVKYAGNDFDNIHFLFQSDGINTYLNSCIFVLYAKNQRDATEKVEKIRSLLANKYQLVSMKDKETGFMIYSGGISPLWDGHWYTMIDNELLSAVHTDVIEYSEESVRLFGNRYGVRLIYGPYNYVKEEF